MTHDTNELTTGRESLAKAYAAAQPGPTLLEVYERWKRSQAPVVAKQTTITRDERAEAQAKLARKAAKKLRKARARSLLPLARTRSSRSPS